MNPALIVRPVFFISDRTGITSENLGHALLTQFTEFQFELHSLPFVNSTDKALKAAADITNAAQRTQTRPLVFSTLIDNTYRTIITETQAYIVDFFDTYINPLEQELKTQSIQASGKSHGIINEDIYMSRIDAVNFTLRNDDGLNIKEYNNADIILTGVSRSGKTPTCLYLAMQFGLKAANYPLTEEDLCKDRLPDILQPYRKKIFGLLINAERLCTIRNIRKQNSDYASFNQCQKETRMVKSLLDNEIIPYIDSSHISVEEIATSIIQIMKLTRPSIY